MDRIDVAIGIVLRDARILICRRRKGDVLAGFWEFPGGKLEPGESPQQCLVREIQEELDIVVDPIESFAPIEFDYPTHQVRLHPYLCQYIAGEARPLAAEQLEWVSAPQLSDYRFPPANDGLIRELQKRLG